MNDKELYEKLNSAFNTDGLEYAELPDRARDNQRLVARYSKKPARPKSAAMLRFASAFAGAFLVFFCGIYILAHGLALPGGNNPSPDAPPPGELRASAVADVKAAYAELLFLTEDFTMVSSTLYSQDNQDRYLEIIYTSGIGDVANVITLNGYVHDDEERFSELCVYDAEFGGLGRVAFGADGAAALALFHNNDNAYLLTVTGSDSDNMSEQLNSGAAQELQDLTNDIAAEAAMPDAGDAPSSPTPPGEPNESGASTPSESGRQEHPLFTILKKFG